MIKMSIDRFKLALLNTGNQVFENVADHLQSQIIEEKRDYPRVTVRRYGRGITGKIANSPRDVVDSGKLRDSFEVVTIISGAKVKTAVQWNTPYAEIIYSGHGIVPPYPWVQIGLRSVYWSTLFKEGWDDNR